MQTQIEKLTDLGSQAVQSAIAEYTNYLFISSICWIGLGLVLFGLAASVWKRREKFEDGIGHMIAVVLVMMAILTVASNVPTLLSPKAKAIYDLITAVR